MCEKDIAKLVAEQLKAGLDPKLSQVLAEGLKKNQPWTTEFLATDEKNFLHAELKFDPQANELSPIEILTDEEDRQPNDLIELVTSKKKVRRVLVGCQGWPPAKETVTLGFLRRRKAQRHGVEFVESKDDPRIVEVCPVCKSAKGFPNLQPGWECLWCVEQMRTNNKPKNKGRIVIPAKFATILN